MRRAIQPRRNEESWQDQAQGLLIEIRALYLASRDRRTPLLAKLVALFVACYFVSPIQLIPNWIPAIGYLDDFVVAIIGLRLVRRLIPPALMDEFVARAGETGSDPNALPRASLAFVVVGLFGLLMATLVWAVIHFLRR